MVVAEISRALFHSIWEMLVQLDYPGLNVSFAGVMVSVLLIRLSISIFKYLTGFSAGGSDYGRATDWVNKGQGKHKLHETLFHKDD